MDNNPYLIRTVTDPILNIVRYERTPEGEEFLKRLVTDTKGPVYVFRSGQEALLTAASMARLSRRGSDLRDIYLDEFAWRMQKAEEVIKRIITEFGDDSVQQLCGVHVVVENASNLATKFLEWGRWASYLEQSTRYIYFDQLNDEGEFRFYTPANFGPEVRRNYQGAMRGIFKNYSEAVRRMSEFVRSKTPFINDGKTGLPAYISATRAQACDAIRPMLPVGATSTVGMFLSAQALESLILHLAASELGELTGTAKRLLTEGRKVIPAFLERADMPERGGATAAYYQANAQAMRRKAEFLDCPRRPCQEQAGVDLLSYTPGDEMEVVARMLFKSSGLPTREIQRQLERWSREKKISVIHDYIGQRLNRRHKPGRALELIHYEWEAVCDYGIFRDLQRHRAVDRLEWQDLTPYYGYDVPELVQEAGLENLFRHNFKISEELYEDLTLSGYDQERQYATLLGHRMRWTYIENWRASLHINELRTSPQGHPGYRKLVNQKHQRQGEVHPILSAAMKFVNQGEDPALTRLAAETATARKLELLDQATI